MNLIIGDSHVRYAFDKEYQHETEESLCIIKTNDWLGLSYQNGLTIWSATKVIENKILEHIPEASFCENIIYIFGTSDAIVKRENAKSPKEYIGEYIKSIDNVRKKCNIKNAYVIIPHYVNDLHGIDYWKDLIDKFNNFRKSNKIISEIKESILLESKIYDHVHPIDITDLFSKNGDLFSNEYTSDGIHFNASGREIFFNKIKQSFLSK